MASQRRSHTLSTCQTPHTTPSHPPAVPNQSQTGRTTDPATRPRCPQRTQQHARHPPLGDTTTHPGTTPRQQRQQPRGKQPASTIDPTNPHQPTTATLWPSTTCTAPTHKRPGTSAADRHHPPQRRAAPPPPSKQKRTGTWQPEQTTGSVAPTSQTAP